MGELDLFYDLLIGCQEEFQPLFGIEKENADIYIKMINEIIPNMDQIQFQYHHSAEVAYTMFKWIDDKIIQTKNNRMNLLKAEEK